MDEWKSEVIRLREEKVPWPTIVDQYQGMFPGKTKRQIQRSLSYLVRRSPLARERRSETAEVPQPKPPKINKKGEFEFDRLIEICETTEITPSLLLSLHGLKPEDWKIVTYTNNYWHSQVKGGTRLIMYQSKLTAKPATGMITFEDVDRYFEGKEYPTPPPISACQYDTTGETLIIDIADLHSGLLAWCRETGADYDIHIVKERFMRVIADNVHRCSGRKFKQIILALLGDLLHIDNDLQQTTKGTFQQSDGRIAKIFGTTLDMLIETVEILGNVAPIDVVYTSGNHDGTSGWMLIKGLQMAFRHDPQVNIDVEPNPQKTRLIGNTLLGFVHGDMPEKNLPGWLQVYARSLPVTIRFLEVHSGHRHAQKVKEFVQTEDNEGVVVRTLPTIASSSTWEHREGYSGATCTSMSFVWHDTYGLREMWYSNM